jgi:hypothetical protein
VNGTVFKIACECARVCSGGFDSHTLPPKIKAKVKR